MGRFHDWLFAVFCAVNTFISQYAAMRFDEPFFLLFVAIFFAFGIAFAERTSRPQAAE